MFGGTRPGVRRTVFVAIVAADRRTRLGSTADHGGGTSE